MEFHEKLQQLRKQRGLTQEELAAELFVSRTAISKWESGRGYPSIDSLKAISQFFSVTIDALLSGEELLTCAQEEQTQLRDRFRGRVFGLLDCIAVLLLFLPFFGQRSGDTVQAVSLLSMHQIPSYLRAAYLTVTAGTVFLGITALALRNRDRASRTTHQTAASLALGIGSVLLFMLSRQPYAAAFSFTLLGGKVLFLLKTR